MTLTDAYVGGDTGAAKSRRRLAETFKHDPATEALLMLRRENTGRYNRLVDTNTRMRVGYYEEAKRAATAEGCDVSGGAR